MMTPEDEKLFRSVAKKMIDSYADGRKVGQLELMAFMSKLRQEGKSAEEVYNAVQMRLIKEFDL